MIITSHYFHNHTILMFVSSYLAHISNCNLFVAMVRDVGNFKSTWNLSKTVIDIYNRHMEIYTCIINTSFLFLKSFKCVLANARTLSTSAY